MILILEICKNILDWTWSGFKTCVKSGPKAEVIIEDSNTADQDLSKCFSIIHNNTASYYRIVMP